MYCIMKIKNQDVKTLVYVQCRDEHNNIVYTKDKKQACKFYNFDEALSCLPAPEHYVIEV